MSVLVFLEHHGGELQRNSLGDLGVDAGDAGEAGSRTEVYALGDPPARGDTVKLEDDGSAAEKIVQFLLEKKAL